MCGWKRAGRAGGLLLWIASCGMLAAPVAAADAPAKRKAAATAPAVDLSAELSAIRAIAELRIVSVSQLLSVVADTPQARSGEWKEIQPLLRSLAETGIDANAIWFARTDGTYFAVDQGLVSANLADRPYFPDLMAGHEVRGALVISKSTQKRSVVIARPVEAGGKVIGALGVSYSVDQLSREIDRDLRLPAGIVFYALDASGRSALHRDPSLMFEYPSDLGDASLRSAVERMLKEPDGTVDYTFRGVRKKITFERSTVLDWVFAVGIPSPAPTN